MQSFSMLVFSALAADQAVLKSCTSAHLSKTPKTLCEGSALAGQSGDAQAAYIIPPDTSIQTVVMADAIQRNCSLAVSTDNDTIIRGVMLFAEQVPAGL